MKIKEGMIVKSRVDIILDMDYIEKNTLLSVYKIKDGYTLFDIDGCYIGVENKYIYTDKECLILMREKKLKRLLNED